MPKRKAVVLFNLGGPDSLEAVKPFLFNLFNDPKIIGLPNPFRKWLASFISSRRTPIAQDIYAHIGGKSPLVEETVKQAHALEDLLEEKDPEYEYQVFICMRYWHPMTEEVVEKVKDYMPEEIVLLPLYPQFSTTTTESSLLLWHEVAKKNGLDIPTRQFCCYPLEQHFVQAQARRVDLYYKKASEKGQTRVLFSAHGLPKKVIKKGDPYQWQVEQTTAAIVEQLNVQHLDWQVCYQSKVGPMKWIGPSTDAEIKRAGEEGVGVMIVPIAFVSEHSETLVELDIEYKHLAEQYKVPHYFRVPALGDDAGFMQGLADMCLTKGKEGKYCSSFNSKICPEEFSRCPNNFYG